MERLTIRFLSTLSLRRATLAETTTPNELPFLSTLSLRRATPQRHGCGRHYLISIHALLAESDAAAMRCIGETSDFYPRSPCGERLC